MDYQAFNHFDLVIIHGMNSLVGRSALFDKAVAFLLGNSISSALLMAVFWAYWFTPAEAPALQRRREILLSALWAGIAGILIARTLALQLPFRLRPRFDPSIHFLTTDLPDSVTTMEWSAFPSDHAVMYFALSVGLIFISWRVGLLATLYVAATICFPRVYLGYHFPTDILVGLMIGSLCACGFNLTTVRRWLAAPVLRWERTAPQSFYMALFFLTFQYATMFDSVREAALSLYRVAERLLAHS
jgi:membrane-associated phospholipid phosphatase